MTSDDDLLQRLNALSFSHPADIVYNPLDYARDPYDRYLERFGQDRKKVIFLGMNPGPFGMAQTGVPFGEIAAVRDWMGISGRIARPAHEHPAKPVLGFDCPRSEVSGRRLWGLFASRFKSASHFFEDHFVYNYCPLLFLENTKSGRNVTPDALPTAETAPLFALCDEMLAALVARMKPEWVIGVGGFAEARARHVMAGTAVKIGRILHPSPASPTANRDWAGAATAQLIAQGIWA